MILRHHFVNSAWQNVRQVYFEAVFEAGFDLRGGDFVLPFSLFVVMMAVSSYC